VSSIAHAADRRPLPESTLVEIFFDAIDRHGSRAALQRMPDAERVESLSYRDVLERVRLVTAALQAHGLARGDRVGIISENRPEWALADYGCLCAGVLDVPIYPTLTAHQVGYLLQDSGTRLVFASTREQADKALEAAKGRGLSVEVVVFDAAAEPREGVVTWASFLASGGEQARAWSDQEFRALAMQAKPADIATVLYTSGTTGEPKGVMLTHNNVASNVRACGTVFDLTDTDNTISFLPLSHILQRMVDYLFFWVGCTIGYPRSMDTLVADMKVIRPTVAVSVPRVYEKIYNGVMQARGVKKALIDWAVRVADRVADVRLAGREPRGLLSLQYAVADKLVFAKIKKAVGGRLRFFVSGGGPLAPVLNRFFYSIGLTILEGYGLTETSPVTNVNTLDHFRIGTVGKPVPSTEIKIADDGEILVRGPQVMKGYYNRPDATAETIDAAGWLATGDIGVLDAEGYLTITDRKKDLIVTAGGKNVAPQPIENRLKTHPLVEQVVMIGDMRKYCILLVVPDFAKLEAWADANGVTARSREELVEDRRVVSYVEGELLSMLGDLASYERPKKVGLLPFDLTIENGFMTPKLSIKRRVVQERMQSLIDALYEEEAVDSAR
jgi:long-chain acyl-CoA synthetase